MCKYDVWCINYPQKEFHFKINNSRGFVVSGEGSGLVTISWKVGAISLISPSLSKQKKHLQFYEFLRILHWTRGSSCRIIKPVYLLSKHVPSFPNYSLHSLSLSFGKSSTGLGSSKENKTLISCSLHHDLFFHYLSS